MSLRYHWFSKQSRGRELSSFWSLHQRYQEKYLPPYSTCKQQWSALHTSLVFLLGTGQMRKHWNMDPIVQMAEAVGLPDVLNAIKVLKII